MPKKDELLKTTVEGEQKLVLPIIDMNCIMFSYVRGGNEADSRSGKEDVPKAECEIAGRDGSDGEKFWDTKSCQKNIFSQQLIITVIVIIANLQLVS